MYIPVKNINSNDPEEKYNLCLAMLENEDLKLVQSLELLCMFLTSHQSRERDGWFELQALKSEDKSYLMQKIEWLKKDGVEKTNSPQNSQEGEKSKEERAKEADEKGSMQSEGEQIITIAFRTCEITFDILGFVVNCIDFETFFDNIKEQLLDSCENFCGGKLSDEKKQKIAS